MPNQLTDAEEVRLLDLSWQNTDKLHLLSVVGSSEEGTAGTEVTGGSYAAQTAAAHSASTTSGVSTKTNNGALAFTGMPAGDVQGWELTDSAGTARKWYGVFNRQTASATASTDKINAAAHGLINGQKVVFLPGFIPAGASAGTAYFVINKTTNDFQISTTSGGSALDITADLATTYFGVVITNTAGATVNIADAALSISLE